MESWSYVPGGKGLVSNETISSSDAFSRTKNSLVGWDLKTQCSIENANILVSGQQDVEYQGFGELGYQQLIGKQVPDNSIRDTLSGKVAGGKIINPLMVASKDFSLEDESSSRLSSTVMDSDSRGRSFIDLKLGRFGDQRDTHNSMISRSTSIVSSTESSAPQRRARVGLISHPVYCQVYGCNKDLSSSKEYHKRHKVCEVHSKTAKVIVNGMEQRFCQQCSRFHLLAEFDDGKRSCRKRLAGHNERRRKPQVSLQSGRNGRLLQSYHGVASGRFHGTALTTSSFVCQEILPGLFHPEKYGANDWCKRLKVEDGPDFNPPSEIPIISGHLRAKSLFPSNNFEKVFATFHDDGANSASGRIFSMNTDRYPHDLGGTTSGSRTFLQDTTLGTDGFTAFVAPSTIQGLSGITTSGCARSLLSSQSQNSSSHSSGIPMARHQVVPGSNDQYSTGQVSEKLIGVTSQASTNGVPNKLPSQRMRSSEGSHLGSMPDGSDAVNFDIITDGIYHGSQFVDAKDNLSCDDGNTIDLLQLSSQLQRVEHEKQSMQLKQENNPFSCPASLNMTSNFL